MRARSSSVRLTAVAPPGVAAGDRYANMEDLFGL